MKSKSKKFKVGDKVKWLHRKEKKVKTGTIVKIKDSTDSPGRKYAKIKTSAGTLHDCFLDLINQ